MREEKKGFIMYADLLGKIETLTMEQRGELFTAILCSQSGAELPKMDPAVDMAFRFIRYEIDRNNEKYFRICEIRREAGKKGGRPVSEKNQNKPNESKENQTKANETKTNQNKPNETKINQNKPNESKENQTKAKKPDNGERITDNGERITDIGDKRENERACARTRVQDPPKLYGPYMNVKLTDADMEKLKAEFPADWEDRIERLSLYIKSKGDKYKDHLATIRNWARMDKDKQSAGIQTANPVNKTAQALQTGYNVVSDWLGAQKGQKGG